MSGAAARFCTTMILGIETSCDETSVALLGDDGSVRVNLIASQIERHQPFGGVVPEIASREHLQHLFPLVRRALGDAGAAWSDVETIAVTAGPGLIGALLVGVAGAQGISYGLGIPLVAVNHLEGHIFSPYLQREGPAIPLPERFLSLVISGGHSSIYDVRGGRAAMLNRTRDDAIGETFDKVAKFVGLPYPGGPQIEKNAQLLADFCATFQDALFEQLFDRLDTIWSRLEAPRPSEVVIAGGVAANGVLRERIVAWGERQGVVVRLPEKRYCTDNATMIAFAGLQKRAEAGDPRRVTARSRIA